MVDAQERQHDGEQDSGLEATRPAHARELAAGPLAEQAGCRATPVQRMLGKLLKAQAGTIEADCD